ncbi:MAG: hypothetical protein H0W72_09980, partial [Planctomycetes bacterium]|nr:hypothetical protein [Planctomycetota bacterium]
MTMLTRLLAVFATVTAGWAASEGELRLPVTYTAPKPGLVSLALYDDQGVLVRSLLSAAKVAAGPGTVTWDGTDDLGRAVKPGTYRAKGVSFPAAPALKWLMKVGKNGNPPWPTPDGHGGWGGNLAYPASITSNGTSAVMVWGCVEDNLITGVQEMDADGEITRRYHTFYPWDTRSASAMDAKNLYVGILSGDHGLEIAEYTLGEPRGRILCQLTTKKVKVPKGRWRGRDWNLVDGLAITADRIYATVAENGELFVIERATGKILDQVAIAKPYGVALAKDRLLVVSGEQVLTCGLDGKPTGVLVAKGQLQAPNAICVHADGTVYVGDSGRIGIDIEYEGGDKRIHVFSAAGKPLRTIGKPGGAPRSGRWDPSALGDITGLCIAPGGKALLVTDVATGFLRTSRWSLSGTLEKEWFGRKLENYSDQINPARPDELIKIGGPLDDPLTFQAWQFDVAKKTWRPAWRYTMPYANCWQQDVVGGYMHGGNPLKDEQGELLPWPIFGWNDGSLRTYKGKNYLLSDEGSLWQYGPDQAPRLVAMVFPHHCERQGERIQTYYDQGPNNWFTWADRNQDQRVQIDETVVTSEPAHLAGSRRIPTMWFGEQLEIYYLRMIEPDAVSKQQTRLGMLPLKELTADGVPVYDWSQAKDLPGDLRVPDLRGGDGTKQISSAWITAPIAAGDSWYTLIDVGCAQPLKLPGIDGDGWWAGRNWRKKIARWDRAPGRCLWAVGRRAPGVA